MVGTLNHTTVFLPNLQNKDLCVAISERTGESLEAVQNLSLQEKTELAQALGLQQLLSSPDQLPSNPGEVDILISRT